jgi:hypothetical protein
MQALHGKFPSHEIFFSLQRSQAFLIPNFFGGLSLNISAELLSDCNVRRLFSLSETASPIQRFTISATVSASVAVEERVG